MWDIQDLGCLGKWIINMWYVRNVVYLGVWDVEDEVC